MAASYDDGSVLLRWQATAGTTKATAARRRRQRSVSTADNGASYKDNGIGLYRRKTTAVAEIDDDAIGGSISLVRGSKQQSTDDRVRSRRRQYNDRWGMGEERYNNQP